MEQLIKDLRECQVGKIKENELLAKHTTIKIGGPADVFVEPSSVDKLIETMNIIKKHQVPWRAIGRGSNLLVSDRGIRGVVIKLGRGMDRFKVENNEVRAGAGLSFIALSTQISRKGYGGLEFASGIPGSVGGAVYMNAGAHGSDVSNILKKAHILFPDGSMEWLTNEEMAFSYRTSILQNKRPGIVIEAVFSLVPRDKEKSSAEMERNKEYRRKTQPWDHRCAGSIFRNPLPKYAGQLVEEAGLKGYQIGGAQISTMHGNFIVNVDHAKADDVLALINHIKETIYHSHGIKMETEVEIVGENEGQ